MTGLKIRFYHWWIYRLFRWTWNPILRLRPAMTGALIEAMQAHLEVHGDAFEKWKQQQADKRGT
jgi:hypothetical protein